MKFLEIKVHAQNFSAHKISKIYSELSVTYFSDSLLVSIEAMASALYHCASSTLRSRATTMVEKYIAAARAHAVQQFIERFGSYDDQLRDMSFDPENQ